jgi:hypothetical protein
VDITAVLDDAPVEVFHTWLARWGAEHDIRCQEVPQGVIHRAQRDGWRVDMQIAALSPTRCELRILWSESEPTERVLRTLGTITAVEHWQALEIDRPLATEYVAHTFSAIRERWRCTKVSHVPKELAKSASPQPATAQRPGGRFTSRVAICRTWWELRDKDDADPSWAAVADALGVDVRTVRAYRRGERGEPLIPDPPPRL